MENTVESIGSMSEGEIVILRRGRSEFPMI